MKVKYYLKVFQIFSNKNLIYKTILFYIDTFKSGDNELDNLLRQLQ